MMAERNLVLAGWVVLALAVAVAVLAQVGLAPGYGLWHDELYSIWASDPTISLGESWDRVAGDSNPPLYFVLLRIGRAWIDDPNALFLVVNAAAMLGAAAFVVWTSWRAGKLAFGLFGAAVLLVCGPSFYFLQEGRTYAFCLAMAFALAWQVALIVASPIASRRLVWIGVFAGLGALGHVYGGLFAGALGAGLVVWSVPGKRKDLLAAGLVSGGVAVAVTAAWFAVAWNRLDNVAFLEFNEHVLRDAFWYVRSMTMGPVWLTPVLVAAIALAVLNKASRPMLVVFGIAATLFVALPIIASFKTPIIMGRYWIVGAPLLLVVLLFVVPDMMKRKDMAGRVAAVAASIMLLAGSIGGYPRAQQQLTLDGDWNGAAIVASLAQACPAGSIHGLHVSDMPQLFAIASGLPADRFTLTAETTAGLKPSEAACPVLAWAEYGDPSSRGQDGSDAGLLARLRIDATPQDVDIIRTNNGFVVLKPDAQTAAQLVRLD